MDDPMKILIDFSDYMTVSNLIIYCWRKMEWALVMGMKFLLDHVEGLLNKVYDLVNFADSKSIQAFITKNNVAIYATESFCLVCFFFCTCNDRKKHS